MTGTGRLFYTEAEKICLQKLILKYKLNVISTGNGNTAAKKLAWSRLMVDYNSISTNSKRTEAQLKKLWDNLKSRRKAVVCQEKGDGIKSGDGIFGKDLWDQNTSEVSIEEALVNKTDMELQNAIDSDHVPEEITSQPEDICMIAHYTDHLYTHVDDNKGEIRRLSRQPATHRQSETGARSIRARALTQEYKKRYALHLKHEEELHKLKIKEQEIKNEREEVLLQKAKIELKIAEETLRVTLNNNKNK